MPRYCFSCECGLFIEVVRPMEDATKPWKCLCGKKMTRNYKAEGVRASGKDYNKPIHSDSLAIAPSQRAEHERLFPDIKLDKQNRPVFDSFKKHDDYLRKTGFKKHRQRKRRKATRIV